jgi:hypothetical protein
MNWHRWLPALLVMLALAAWSTAFTHHSLMMAGDGHPRRAAGAPDRNASERTLAINPAEAETVRCIFALYLEFGCVRRVKQQADQLGLAQSAA